jgi:hypothetical protein
MDNSKRRLSLTSSARKLRLDSVNKIIKLDKNRKQKKTIDKPVSRVALAELIKNAPTSQRYQPPDFKTFLSHEENVTAFKEFLQTQYCQENLDFYLACEKFRNLDSSGVGKELVKFMATQIYNDYLSEDARQPVNVSDACVQIIKNNLKNPKPDIFCDAQAEIFDLMRTDCYPRFCKTWQLDRDFAQKILHQTPQAKYDRSSCMISFTSEKDSNITNILSSSSTTNSLVETSRRLSSRLSSRTINSSRSSNSTSECPPECPYFRIGRLPCQGHKRVSPRNRVHSHKRKPDAIPPLEHHLDLKKIHRPPAVLIPENGLPFSSPPPPLPPKPGNLDFTHMSNRKYHPHVGKVLNV